MPGLWSPPAGSAHREFGLRWAFTVEDLKEWFRKHAPSDAFLVALEKGAVDAAGVRQPTTAGYHFAACTLPQLVALLETARNQPSQLNFYEYIVDERPRRVAFDLEFELAEPKGRHRERAAALWPSDYEAVFAEKELFLRRTLVDVILPALSALAGRTLSAADCYVTDSSKPAKQSYHVVLDVVLPDAPSRLAFHNWIQATFLKGGDTQRLAPLMDCTVYGDGRPMRLVGCNKVGKVGDCVPHTPCCLRPLLTLSLAGCGGATPRCRACCRWRAWAASPSSPRRRSAWRRRSRRWVTASPTPPAVHLDRY
jgi:hypothetical protein